MAKAKTEPKKILEREYTIPLRREFLKVPRYKRANKAIKAIKQFLVKHMKVYDRDLNKIKIDKYVNEEIWFRGIKKPPVRIKIKAKKDENGIVRVELAEIPQIIQYKIEREKRTEKAGKSDKRKAEQTKAEGEKLEGKIEKEKEGEKKEEQTKEEKKEESEKEKSTVESGLKAQRKQAKQAKHTSADKKQVIHRMAMQK